LGKCPDCGAWDSFVEQTVAKQSPTRSGLAVGPSRPTAITEVETGGFERLPVEGEEFTRVLGGGIVPGSLVLIGGDPGIGKSTLLLAVGANFAKQVGSVLYISAEESAQQLRLRADRLGMLTPRLFVLSETNLDLAVQAITQLKPSLVVVDSVQTFYLEEITSAAGSVSQVREVALRLLRLAKESGIPVFLWDTSPRKAQSPDHACWSILSMWCSTWKAIDFISTGCCAASRTASARPMKLVSLR